MTKTENFFKGYGSLLYILSFTHFIIVPLSTAYLGVNGWMSSFIAVVMVTVCLSVTGIGYYISTIIVMPIALVNTLHADGIHKTIFYIFFAIWAIDVLMRFGFFIALTILGKSRGSEFGEIKTNIIRNRRKSNASKNLSSAQDNETDKSSKWKPPIGDNIIICDRAVDCRSAPIRGDFVNILVTTPNLSGDDIETLYEYQSYIETINAAQNELDKANTDIVSTSLELKALKLEIESKVAYANKRILQIENEIPVNDILNSTHSKDVKDFLERYNWARQEMRKALAEKFKTVSRS